MDTLDKAILMELSQNCRASYSALAKKYHITVNTIKNRIQKLVDRTIIRGFVVQLNPAFFPANLALFLFQFAKKLSKEQIGQLGSHPLISAIGIGLDTGYLVIYYRSNEELSQVADFLHTVEELQDFEIYPILPPPSSQDLTPRGSLEDLNAIDWQLLFYLRHNGRMSLHELSKKTNISTRTVRKRLDLLRKQKLIIETILLNPGVIESGLMAFFKVELRTLTTKKQLEIEQQIHQTLSDNFWVSWKVVDRPVLLLGFQTASANELTHIRNKLDSLLPNSRVISQIVGGEMLYFSDFRDDLLDKMQKK